MLDASGATRATLQAREAALLGVCWARPKEVFTVGSRLLQWDVRTRAPPVALAAEPNKGPHEAPQLQCVASHPQKPQIVAAGSSEGAVYVWDVAAAAPLATVRAHAADVWAVQLRESAYGGPLVLLRRRRRRLARRRRRRRRAAGADRQVAPRQRDRPLAPRLARRRLRRRTAHLRGLAALMKRWASWRGGIVGLSGAIRPPHRAIATPQMSDASSRLSTRASMSCEFAEDSCERPACVLRSLA